jgi:hypothetical protein
VIECYGRAKAGKEIGTSKGGALAAALQEFRRMKESRQAVESGIGG